MVSLALASLRAPARRIVRPSPFRAGRQPQTRLASSNSSSTGSKVSEAASTTQQKATDALASAQKGLEKATEAAKKIGGSVGERAGSMLGSYREPLLYNLSVGRELLKQVYISERLQPPTSFSAISSAYSSLWSRASNPAYWRELVRSGEWQRVGIYALEAYGIFKIGEMVGRRSIVGYKLDD